jgi:hypothetical protein
VVDPQNSTIGEHRPECKVRTYSHGRVELDDVVDGFQLDVDELFS